MFKQANQTHYLMI